MLRSLARQGLAAALIGAAFVVAPGLARADGIQLCRAFTSILLAPTDIALSPVISARDLHHGPQHSDAEPASVKLLIGPLGYAWLNMLQVYGGFTRLLQGIWDIAPGTLNLFREGSGAPLYVVSKDGAALYSQHIGPCPIQIGMSHQDIGLN